MTRSRFYRKKYARELVGIAEHDLQAGKVLADASLRRRESVLFFAQQAVEKSLKAVLCVLEKPLPLTNDLELIIDRLEQCGLQVPHAEDVAE